MKSSVLFLILFVITLQGLALPKARTRLRPVIIQSESTNRFITQRLSKLDDCYKDSFYVELNFFKIKRDNVHDDAISISIRDYDNRKLQRRLDNYFGYCYIDGWLILVIGNFMPKFIKYNYKSQRTIKSPKEMTLNCRSPIAEYVFINEKDNTYVLHYVYTRQLGRTYRINPDSINYVIKPD